MFVISPFICVYVNGYLNNAEFVRSRTIHNGRNILKEYEIMSHSGGPFLRFFSRGICLISCNFLGLLAEMVYTGEVYKLWYFLLLVGTFWYFLKLFLYLFFIPFWYFFFVFWYILILLDTCWYFLVLFGIL